MSIVNKEQLKEYFLTGKKPTQGNYSDLVDTMFSLPGPTGPTGPAGSGGGGGTGSIAIDLNQIAFGTGTGITSSENLTFDGANMAVNFTDDNTHMLLDADNKQQWIGDVTDTYGGSKIAVSNQVGLKGFASAGRVVRNGDTNFTGSGVNDLTFSGAYNQFDAPSFEVTIVGNGVMFGYTLTSGTFSVPSGNELLFDNGAVAIMVNDTGSELIVLYTSGDPASASTFEVISGPDTGVTGNCDLFTPIGNVYVMNCSSVANGVFGFVGYSTATINGITCTFGGSTGHNNGDNWQMDIVVSQVYGLSADYTNNEYGIGDITEAIDGIYIKANDKNITLNGNFAHNRIGALISFPDNNPDLMNGINLDYTNVSNSSDITIGNNGLFNGSKLDLYEDDGTQYLGYYDDRGHIWLDFSSTIDNTENASRAYQIGDVSGDFSQTLFSINETAKLVNVTSRISSYDKRTSHIGVGVNDITIDGDYSGYEDTITYTISILENDIQEVNLNGSASAGNMNIGDTVACSPGDPGPLDATGIIYRFVDGDLNRPLIKVSSSDLFIAGSLFTNITTGYSSTVLSAGPLSDFVRIRDTNGYLASTLLTNGNYITWGISYTAQIINGHSIGDSWSFRITTRKGIPFEVNNTESTHRLGVEDYAALIVDTRYKVTTTVGGRSYTGSIEADNFIATEADHYFDIDTTINAVNVSLPSIISLKNDNQEFVFSDVRGNAPLNNIVLNCFGSDTIMGASTKSITNSFGSITIKSNKQYATWVVTSIV